MAVTREIRTKIGSVGNTQKITKAMEMVAASKMRKTQVRMRAARPYADKMRNVITHLGLAHSEYRHTLMEERTTLRGVGVLVVSSDRGLCGGLNANLFRELLTRMKSWEDSDVRVELGVIGNKAASFFGQIGARQIGQTVGIGDIPGVDDLVGIVKLMIDAYADEKIDRLYIACNGFVNSMTQRPAIEQLLPLPKSTDEALKFHWDYIYEPEAQDVVEHLMRRYIESLVYQCVVENIACEQAARMVAMKSASDNAGKLIEELQLIYNKARQAAITQELSEIMGGAAAIS